uniref:Uncharacterized protein n=1 Tax=Arcella intermedia TaxID=1963864 RepID=A0A6B2KWS0_9EUKA|eukprot:TRINITY_DN23106_c0_g1_i1.p1 TRINITY_DN23106_c0_g1~~TRINITY_DN23106_c0_g1_i1.p1  ORF type:complete len:1280 (-),score=292.97 TRINITY_DN23106_c0_g1_i1:23-3862(-)
MEDSSSSGLRYLLGNCFAPSILVLTTKEVEEACLKNKVTFLSLLSLFSKVQKKITYRLVNGSKTIRREYISVNCLSPEMLSQSSSRRLPPPQVIARCTDEQNLSPDQLPIGDVKKLQAFLKSGRFQTPWFDRYCWQFFKSVGCSEHEVFDHPVAVMMVTSSNDPEPFKTYQSLFTTHKSSIPNYMDQFVLKIYVVLQDCYGIQPVKLPAPQHVELKQRLFPAQIHFVNINSLPELRPIPQYLNLLEQAPPVQASYLSNSDWESVSELLGSAVSEEMINYMKAEINNINQEVERQRSGIGHKFKMWFGKSLGPKKNDGGADALRYELNSLEFQQRRLADWAYMLEDYWLAHKTYKSLSEVYHSDNSPLWEAGALEMQAVSSFMMGATPSPIREEDTLLDQAEKCYTRVQGTQYHTRRCQKIRGMMLSSWFKDRIRAAQFYAFLGDRESTVILRALYLEQAAYSYLQLPGRVAHRKFAFRMILAAEIFEQLSLVDHAVRCLSQAYCIYANQDWSAIDDQLHFKIARFSFLLGRVDVAASFMYKLLASNSQSAPLQNQYIREYIHIENAYKKLNPNKQILDVPLPVIDTKKVKIRLRDDSDEGSGKGDQDPVFKVLEEDIESLGIPKDKRSFTLFLRKKKNKSRMAIVNENIFVETEMHNPLNVPLQLTDMRLICEATEKKNGDSGSSSSSGKYEVIPCDTLLAPLSVKNVLFAIKPLCQGTIAIKGITFKLFGQVEGKRLFGIATGTNSKGLEVIQVCEEMPLLTPSFIDWPSQLHHGELCPITLRLLNNGQTAISSIRMSMSHPGFFSIPQFNQSVLDLWSRFEDITESNLHLSTIEIPLKENLRPSNSIDVPIWIRAFNTGHHHFKFLFRYTSDAVNSTIPSRIQRAVASMEILPSLNINTMIYPSQLMAGHWMVGMEVENLASTKIDLSQLQIIGKYWEGKFISSTTGEDVKNMSIDVGKKVIYFCNLSLLENNECPTASVINKEKPEETVQISLENYQLQYSTPFLKDFGEKNGHAFPLYDNLYRERVLMEGKNHILATHGKTGTAGFAAFVSSDEKKQTSSDQVEFDKKTIENAQTIHNHFVHLMLTWRSNEKVGQFNHINISLLPPQTTNNLPQNAPIPVTRQRTKSTSLLPNVFVEESVPLTLTLESITEIQNFQFNNSFCQVPISVIVMNISPISSVDFEIEALKPSDALPDNYARLYTLPQKRYFWSGVTSYQHTLAPKQSVTIQLTAVFTSPGTYNINRLKLNAHSPDPLNPKHIKDYLIYSTTSHLVIVT